MHPQTSFLALVIAAGAEPHCALRACSAIPPSTMADAALAEVMEMGVTEMQAILGEACDRAACEQLLRETKGDVSSALNRFFDGGSGGGPAAPFNPWLVAPSNAEAQSMPPEAVAVAAAVAAPPSDGSWGTRRWPRLLGQAQVSGICLGSLKHGELREWEPLVLQLCRQPPKAKAKAKALKGGGKALLKGGKAAASRPLPFGQAAEAAGAILRFSPAADPTRQLGRLPSSLTDCLAPLLDEGKVELQLCCAALPPGGVGIGGTLRLHLRVALTQAAFSAAAAAASVDEGEGAQAALARRFAMVRLLSQLGTLPRVPAATQVGGGGGGGGGGHGAASAGGEGEEAELDEDALQQVYPYP